MSVKFGKDGTIYCNTVRYNYKEARNMIADGCYGNISGIQVWAGAVASTNPKGYKSYRCFKIAPNKTIAQSLPTLITNHKYYYSARVYSDGALNGAIRLTDSSANALSEIYLGSHYTSHTLVSNLFTPTYNIRNIILFCVNYNNNAYLSKFIMIDLTDTFGAGNEPTKEWCDNNIREQQTICNFGNVANHVTYSNIETRYTGVHVSKLNYNYLQLDSNWEPRDYMYYLQGLAKYVKGYLGSASAFALDNTRTYYAYVEQHTEQVSGVTQSNDFYFPVAQPSMGSIPLVDETTFNGGGGMRDWKRVSAFATRTSFSSGSYKSRFNFNNNKQTNVQRLTAFNIVNVRSPLTQYNNYNGTSVTMNDINKEWCDRWIDGRSSPVIHIKDPANTSIKFNTDYDIICNDIEIRPELNKIIFDGTTGTIKCKKLVRAQVY